MNEKLKIVKKKEPHENGLKKDFPFFMSRILVKAFIALWAII